MKQARIAVFVHHPECSIQSAHGIIRALAPEYAVECVDTKQITVNNLKKYDVIAMPGGIGDSNTWHDIFSNGRDEIIQDRVAQGMRYLGICMGAYWAGSHYFDLLRGVDAVQYIRQPGTDIRRSFGTVVPVYWHRSLHYMYFYDGCALVRSHGRFRTIATYANGDAAAIIQGRIGVIGPHPESDEYWYTKPYMQPYWHEFQHHQLLLDFTNQLLDR